MQWAKTKKKFYQSASRPCKSKSLFRSLEEAEKSLDEDFLKKRIQKLQQDIKLSESSKSHTMSTLSDLQSELKLLEISQRSLQEDLNSSNEAISNLFTIKEDLLQKTLHFENVENALTVKLNSHQQDEKNLVKDLCYFKRLAEEAVLSFQKFSVKYIGIISQNAGIIISEFNAKPYIALQIGKQEYYLAHEPSCTVYMHPKKKNRFFICLDGKNREFESAHSEKIAHSISAALHKSLNI